ncbi:histidine kinase [Burkholderiales bacterium JOSHI_001]|nr:histidine kinase [Burkholderiales bacterium JOSHI_001]
MLSPRRPWLLPTLAWAGASAVAAGLLTWQALAQQHAAFETDARIAHRLLSQRAAQHDAILATLGLLQPGADGSAPQARLPALYPQVLAVLQRPRGQAWGDAALDAAEAQSRRSGHAVATKLALDSGRFTLLAAAEPASHALVLDVRAMVPTADWPYAAAGPGPRVSLEAAGQSLTLHAGPADLGPRPFRFAKPLSSPSQPFDVVVQQPVGLAALPWVRMAGAALALAAAFALARRWRQQAAARRRAEELLRLGQVARLNTLGELAAGMAHELNQPLTAVMASTQAAQRLLADDPPELDVARQAMGHAAAQARRASEVLTRLRRTVERPDLAAGTQTLDLGAQVRDTLDLLAPECHKRGVTVALDTPAAAVAVTAEPVALQQIAHNLVLNALQAMEQVPAQARRLELLVRADATGGRLVVRDSGPGIAPEALPRVFEPFFSTRAGGLGLGLSLCESLAQGLGGALAVANHAPRGAEFTLTLPLAAPA